LTPVVLLAWDPDPNSPGDPPDTESSGGHVTTSIIVIVVMLLLLAALRLWLTANRLDRLHVRTEAAWAALEGALSRRVVAARALAAAGGLAPERAALLRGLARQADIADRGRRAAAENNLSRSLAALPTGVPEDLRGELADAQERLTLARRFYNDAVRDTKALRQVRFTRFFRLAGSAAMPQYFEITEFHPPPVEPTAGPTEPPTEPMTEPPSGPLQAARRSGRVVLLDDRHRVLLFHGYDPGRPGAPGFWFTPGGGVEPGEDEAACALRELREETGLVATGDDLVGPVWVRRVNFEFMGEALAAEETFFALQVHGDSELAIDMSGFTDLERDTVDRFRWWSAAELADTDDLVYPQKLAARLGEVIDMLSTVEVSAPVPID